MILKKIQHGSMQLQMLLCLWLFILPSSYTTVTAAAAAASSSPQLQRQAGIFFAKSNNNNNKADHLLQSIQHQIQFTTSTRAAWLNHSNNNNHWHRQIWQKIQSKQLQLLPTQRDAAAAVTEYCSTSTSSALDATTSTTTTAAAAAANSIDYTVRVGLAGGIAGAAGTTALFPMDSAKTLRQANPESYRSVTAALHHLIKSPPNIWHIHRAYAGVLPAAIGAIPSSALYFGAYEACKRFITHRLNSSSSSSSSKDGAGGSIMLERTSPHDSIKTRLFIHATAAASGNILSSMIFVPKEVIKQQMQYYQANLPTTVNTIFQNKGFAGFFKGYQATLMRNIPSAALRFVIYEELKRQWYSNSSYDSHDDSNINTNNDRSGFSWKLFAAGAVAGAMASGIMTPVDVIKTRMCTGTCPVDVPSCIQHVIEGQGVSALYAGAGSRMLCSGAFAAIGFGTFETAKKWLGVSDDYWKQNSHAATRSRQRRQQHKQQQQQKRVLPWETKPAETLEKALLDRYER